jgi:hypothetical protein
METITIEFVTAFEWCPDGMRLHTSQPGERLDLPLGTAMDLIDAGAAIEYEDKPPVVELPVVEEPQGDAAAKNEPKRTASRDKK